MISLALSLSINQYISIYIYIYIYTYTHTHLFTHMRHTLVCAACYLSSLSATDPGARHGDPAIVGKAAECIGNFAAEEDPWI